MIDAERTTKSVMSLKLDSLNPRLADEEPFADFEEALEELAQVGALDELVSSIAASGWIDYEPLIVLRSTMEVIEGNRRLAALRIVREPDLGVPYGIKVPDDLHPNAKPDDVEVWIVDHRRDARDFIGFKHINGPFKWDSFAKAKYAAEWLDEGDEDLATVSRRLGDGHRTVARLVNGYRVLQQAERLGFERSAIPTKKFAFSHLYTALTRPSYREYLGLADSTDLLPHDPIDDDHRDELTQTMLWLYGQDETPPAIRSQNPDLKKLAEVLTSKTATSMLRSDPDLVRAHAVVEDKEQIFAEALFALDRAASDAIRLVGGYQGEDEGLTELAQKAMRTARSIHAAMAAVDADGVDGVDGDDD